MSRVKLIHIAYLSYSKCKIAYILCVNHCFRQSRQKLLWTARAH